MTQFVDITKQTEKLKKTKFTHYLDESAGWNDTNDTPTDSDNLKVVYLGNCSHDGDMFAVYTEDDVIYIYKGTKGDEFV